jgi:hypothetical protein
MGWKPLLPEGISGVDRTNRIALHCDDTLRAAGSWKEMTSDWMFFSVGCIYTYGGLDRDIVAEFTSRHGDPDCSVMRLQSIRPFFSGMCPPGWKADPHEVENVLLATPLEYWEDLRTFIAQTGLVDRKRGRYAQPVAQELEIVDYLAVYNAIIAEPRPPTITITAFGIDGTHYHVGFAARTANPQDTAAVVHLPIRPETKRVGEAILAGDMAPLMETLEVKPADPADIKQKIQEAEEKIP